MPGGAGGSLFVLRKRRGSGKGARHPHADRTELLSPSSLHSGVEEGYLSTLRTHSPPSHVLGPRIPRARHTLLGRRAPNSCECHFPPPDKEMMLLKGSRVRSGGGPRVFLEARSLPWPCRGPAVAPALPLPPVPSSGLALLGSSRSRT